MYMYVHVHWKQTGRPLILSKVSSREGELLSVLVHIHVHVYMCPLELHLVYSRYLRSKNLCHFQFKPCLAHIHNNVHVYSMCATCTCGTVLQHNRPVVVMTYSPSKAQRRLLYGGNLNTSLLMIFHP